MLKMEMDNKLRDMETNLWSNIKDDTNNRLVDSQQALNDQINELEKRMQESGNPS
jgi:hypothetical protein